MLKQKNFNIFFSLLLILFCGITVINATKFQQRNEKFNLQSVNNKQYNQLQSSIQQLFIIPFLLTKYYSLNIASSSSIIHCSVSVNSGFIRFQTSDDSDFTMNVETIEKENFIIDNNVSNLKTVFFSITSFQGEGASGNLICIDSAVKIDSISSSAIPTVQSSTGSSQSTTTDGYSSSSSSVSSISSTGSSVPEPVFTAPPRGAFIWKMERAVARFWSTIIYGAGTDTTSYYQLFPIADNTAQVSCRINIDEGKVRVKTSQGDDFTVEGNGTFDFTIDNTHNSFSTVYFAITPLTERYSQGGIRCFDFFRVSPNQT